MTYQFFNVEQAVQHLPNVTVIDVDELSKMRDETLTKREADVPKAKAIIADHLAEFIEWHDIVNMCPF